MVDPQVPLSAACIASYRVLVHLIDLIVMLVQVSPMNMVGGFLFSYGIYLLLHILGIFLY